MAKYIYKDAAVSVLHRFGDQIGEETENRMRMEMNRIPAIDIMDEPYIPPACRNCPNHPSNGGSGICHCTLGLPQITC